ncbi:MAG: hypothetical protein H6741_29005 [Alphaproteobacteria bacterium]|nr:hypothetical protein [Alphaproteobacteria bacterium]
MGHQAVHRVSLRMRFDPGLVARVYADADEALPELAPEERAWLLAVDRRAWGSDPMLRSRTLRALYTEFKGATTLAAAELRRLSALEAFFSSPVFHEEMQARGSLARAWARYLRSLHLRTPQLAPILELEEALAVCRRELELAPERLRAPPEGPWVARARGVGALSLPGGALEALNRVEEYLFTLNLLPVMALCSDAPRPTGLPPLDPSAPRALVLQPSLGGGGLRELGRTVCTVLSELDTPRPLRAFVDEYAARGLGRAQASALLEDLRGAGLVALAG